jgi:hypothetical protein
MSDTENKSDVATDEFQIDIVHKKHHRILDNVTPQKVIDAVAADINCLYHEKEMPANLLPAKKKPTIETGYAKQYIRLVDGSFAHLSIAYDKIIINSQLKPYAEEGKEVDYDKARLASCSITRLTKEDLLKTDYDPSTFDSLLASHNSVVDALVALSKAWDARTARDLKANYNNIAAKKFTVVEMGKKTRLVKVDEKSSEMTIEEIPEEKRIFYLNVAFYRYKKGHHKDLKERDGQPGVGWTDNQTKDARFKLTLKDGNRMVKYASKKQIQMNDVPADKCNFVIAKVDKKGRKIKEPMTIRNVQQVIKRFSLFKRGSINFQEVCTNSKYNLRMESDTVMVLPHKRTVQDNWEAGDDDDIKRFIKPKGNNDDDSDDEVEVEDESEYGKKKKSKAKPKKTEKSDDEDSDGDTSAKSKKSKKSKTDEKSDDEEDTKQDKSDDEDDDNGKGKDKDKDAEGSDDESDKSKKKKDKEKEKEKNAKKKKTIKADDASDDEMGEPGKKSAPGEASAKKSKKSKQTTQQSDDEE